ncbi:hypothetical protein Ancab_036785 [Ancistrocladus abbreviatus]
MEGLRIRTKQQQLKPINSTKGMDKAQKGGMGYREASEEDEPLSPGSRMFHEPDFNVHTLAIMGSKAPIDVDVIMSKLPYTLLKHPRFSSLVVEDKKRKGGMKWVRIEVDLKKHIVVPHIDSTSINTIVAAEKFIEDYIYNLSKTTLDKSRPLWDLHLLNVKTSEAEAIGILRVHHSLGDGMSLMSLFLACTRQISNPNALPTLPGSTNKSKKKKKVEGGGYVKGISWFVVAGWWLLQLLWNTAMDILMFSATFLFLKDTVTPLMGPPGVEFTPRRVVYKTVSLDDMKLVKKAMDATINDIALGITQAGLSRYLNRKYGTTAVLRNYICTPGENRNGNKATMTKKNNLPKNIRLRSTLLINLRPAAGIQALADMMEKDTEAKWGNWIGFVLLRFIIGLRDDPLDYVREAKATVDRKKRSLEAIYTFSISELVFKFLGIKVASALSHRVITQTTLSFSNMVGPLEEIGFYGHPIAFLAPSCYGQPHGLMIIFQSYVNKMSVVLSVDEDTVPDPHQLCEDIVESLELIKDAVIAKDLVRKDEIAAAAKG